MSLLPELLERLGPVEAAPYAGTVNVRRVAANTTATPSDGMILCDASAGAFVVQLPTAVNVGLTLVIVKVDTSGNAITVTPFGNDTIESGTSKTLAAQWQKLVITADGVSAWIDESTQTV
jgi:type IV secretory pathway TrbF-like protein